MWRVASRKGVLRSASTLSTYSAWARAAHTVSAWARDPRFSVQNAQDIDFFRQILGDSGMVTDISELSSFNNDWMGKYCGSSRVALKPRTTEQVSQILAYCNERKLAVVPQGGNTGLVGGSVPLHDEVVLSLAAMNNITSFDPVEGILTCQAGCVLKSLMDYVEDKGFIMPLEFGAKGRCQIGGNVSTNAGGMRLLRYGSLHGTVLGLEVVLANGARLDLNRGLRKDNTGYDLKQLFIGAEGTLGVVTSVSVLLAPKPRATNVTLLACRSFDAVQEVFMEARNHLSEILSAFEFLDRTAMEYALKYLDHVHDPMPGTNTPFYVLIETSGSNGFHDSEKLERFLDASTSKGLVANGIIAQDQSETAAIWRIREGVAEALGRAGAVYKYDLSMPVPLMYKLVEEMRTRLDGRANVLGFGHLGDGNLHLNVSTPGAPYSKAILEEIEPYVYVLCQGDSVGIHA
mmetsp:Transcript_30770/g.57953  ORF Transcript_30770/g.57953 Transcript_30770/m.57953 type:complete len:460 (+) Transcript_30770:511-1890(+)